MKETDMNTLQEIQDEKDKVHAQETPKAGTWISAGVVGAVILATYFVLYGFYMARV
jgi:flagellar biosynthesis/type III secretory pathway M-ring protein FliF/YscJ